MEKTHIVLLVFAAIALLVFFAFQLFIDYMNFVLSDINQCENAILQWDNVCKAIALESTCNEKDINGNKVPDCIWAEKQDDGKKHCVRITAEHHGKIPAEHIGIAGVPEECQKLT